MKRVVSIGLIFILMFSNIQKFWIVVDFCINQDYISEVFCINKDKPMLNCDGKCFLAQKLKEQEQKEKKEFPSSLKEKNDLVYFYSTEGAVQVDNKYDSLDFSWGQIVSFYSPKYLDQIFKPPKAATA